ncbi:hypothetical protein D9623_19625 [Azospirillum brasilense]|uniref:DUF2628 domain-containing protein n=1 Tax=Azospirillum brasilense TaxID=192 RepID=A0A0P0FBX0_AZOBR|nr:MULTISPECIES: hypothetical protein [Azospirillum]ALJ37688.1 hypothetical protein AMK58_19840 [Azospirillum brasilense]MDW7553905.1 hypothetical protein [Azospirillum brasilense]MDW7592656.1 hypothetical protein [Azospirillum brasilense]MDW7628187.1 hypothetical protein [Azospirillum brasilense]MDX5952126.1 hypothetical protein [Azospirillum brasilense]
MAAAPSGMVFENPENGQREAVTNREILWAFLLGPVYFAKKAEWLHAGIHALLILISLLLWPTGVLMTLGVWVGYACAAPTILEYRYQKMGWEKVAG